MPVVFYGLSLGFGMRNSPYPLLGLGCAAHILGFWVSHACLTPLVFRVLDLGFGMCCSCFGIKGLGCFRSGMGSSPFRVWDVLTSH